MSDKLSTVDGDGRLTDDPKLHAPKHTDGTDDIQDATGSQKGLLTAVAQGLGGLKTFNAGLASNAKIALNNAGTDSNSYELEMIANSGGVSLFGSLFIAYGADPYMAISVPNGSGVKTAVLHVNDTYINPASPGAYDLGHAGSKFKDVHLSGNVNVDGNVDGVDVSGIPSTYQAVSEKDQVSGYAGLDGSGKINASQMPPIAIMDIHVVASEVAQLAITPIQIGDLAIRTDQNKTYINITGNNTAMSDWQELLTPTDVVTSVFSRTGAITAQNGDYTGSQITNTPAGGIAAVTVQAALNELDGDKENTFSKNTAFNKNFGTGAGQITEGDKPALLGGRPGGQIIRGGSGTSGTDDLYLYANIGGTPYIILREGAYIRFEAATDLFFDTGGAGKHYFRGPSDVERMVLDTLGNLNPKGNLTMETGKTVDGIDISDIPSTYESIISPKNTAFNKSFGTGSGEVCEGNDARLSDARTPLSHVHGNISNGGLIGVTASLPIITGTGGILQAGAFGTGAGQFCQGNDSRLSDARTPTAHALGGSAHSADTIANLNTKISNLIATYGGLRDIGVGTLVQRPAFGTANRFFWTTDEQKLYRDTGSAWETLAGIGSIAHSATTGQTTDDHHAKSHNHSSASGAGAIATDQIAKFGDGGTTNYAEIQTTGKFRAYGTGRFKRVIYTLAPSMAIGGTMSFNGNSYGASTYTLISTTDRPALFRRFDYTNPLERNYAIAQTVLPLDYVAGTDFEICIAWCSPATSGNVVWTLGLLGVSDGDSYGQTPAYTSLPASTVPGTAYNRKTDYLTITGTGYLPGDCIPMVLLRQAGSGSDTMTDDALVAGIGVKYISDKLGADV